VVVANSKQFKNQDMVWW